ncbi:MAG: hypothetical protein JST44_19890 [Cyanobacteria bacterium SZAS LIN-5]|nr:hypothetical protein [Cyanobacteria bacterium SZAS LIN-5]
MSTTEKDQIIKAINDLGRRVTAADVATKTGLPLLKATSELNKVAAETNGHLQVSTAGDIAYTFDAGFQNAYLAQGMKKTIKEIGDKIFKVGFFLLRISFGVGLILSFLVIVVLIIAAIFFAQRGSDSDSDSGYGGGFGGFDFFDWMLLRNFFYWGPTYPVYVPYDYNDYGRNYDLYDKPTTRQPETNNNFIMNCFSFLFGDGPPNLNLEERKWQLIAQTIKQHNGVVTAEQLAPFTGADPANEDGVLPVLVRFDGKPEVTESGNIVYTFPNLQVTAKSMSFAPLPPFLKEFEWEFTSVPASALVPVFILAGLNFFGAIFLVTHLWIPVLHAFAGLIHGLMLYGTLFLAVPTIRYAVIRWLNGNIQDRNAQRSKYAEVLRNPPATVVKKLAEANQYRIGEKRVRADDLVYSTEHDVIDQDFNHEDRKFDEELRKGAQQQKQHQPPQHQPPQITQDAQNQPDHIISLNPKEKSEVKPIKSKRPWQ